MLIYIARWGSTPPPYKIEPEDPRGELAKAWAELKAELLKPFVPIVEILARWLPKR